MNATAWPGEPRCKVSATLGITLAIRAVGMSNAFPVRARTSGWAASLARHSFEPQSSGLVDQVHGPSDGSSANVWISAMAHGQRHAR